MDETYTDQKGRTRWRCNDAIAEKLKELYDFLVIGNYEESHAARYPRLAHTLSRHPESVLAMRDEGRLKSLPGVSEIIEQILLELLETGTCRKMDEGDEFFTPPPRSVLELTKIPRLGAKTARVLFQDHGIDGLGALKVALDTGQLAEIKGVGKGMIATIRKHLQTQGFAGEP
ncbi:MAG: helix-hairpin-helix domain-containing protein [Planctomycetota bacterium]